MPTLCLMDVVNRCVQEDKMTLLHSYNDLDLIAGHARYIASHNTVKQLSEVCSVSFLPTDLYRGVVWGLRSWRCFLILMW